MRSYVLRGLKCGSSSKHILNLVALVEFDVVINEHMQKISASKAAFLYQTPSGVVKSHALAKL